MRKHTSPEGPENASFISETCAWADMVIAAWGAHGDHLDQGFRVRDLLAKDDREVHSFGQTKAGHPRHPLYIAYAQKPEVWSL